MIYLGRTQNHVDEVPVWMYTADDDDDVKGFSAL